MTPQQAIQILHQVQQKFVGSGQEHQILAEAIKAVSDSPSDQPEITEEV